MDVLSVVVGVFCFFLFQWLFRGIFLFLLIKIAARVMEQARGKIDKAKGDLEDAMQNLRNDEK